MHDYLGTRCRNCGISLPADSPSWVTRCRGCYAEFKRREAEAQAHELADLRLTVALLRQQLQDARTAPPPPPAIDYEMTRRLLQLCHPDRHGNSEAATAATRFLLDLKRRLEVAR